jgi:hypothetical protein
MTYALMLAFFRNEMGFGGNNRFTDFKKLLGTPLKTAFARGALCYASLVALVLCCLLCRWLTATKYGRVLTAIQDAETRARFPGYASTSHKLFAFVRSAMMAWLTGTPYVPQVGIINPSEFCPGDLIGAVVWVAVSGRGTLVGAVLGACSVNGLKTWLTSAAPELWLFVLGRISVLVTLFLPRGLIGLFKGRGQGRDPLPRSAAAARDRRAADAGTGPSAGGRAGGRHDGCRDLTRPRPARQQGRQRGVRPLPHPVPVPEAARRRPLGRAAAANHHRARSLRPATPADPRRADRGNAALGRQEYRARHRPPGARPQDG